MLNKKQTLRLQTMLGLCFLLFVILLGRMVYLQLWRGVYYTKQSDGNRLRQSRIIAPRGLIFDKNGKELVNNLPGYAVVLRIISRKHCSILASFWGFLWRSLKRRSRKAKIIMSLFY